MDTKTDFENIGMGISSAGGWHDLNGRRVWVSLSAISEGRGRRRTWNVIAQARPDGQPMIQVTATVANCFRYEAADVALAELAPFVLKAAA